MPAVSERAITQNPFPGLRPFRTEETHLFFGREGQVDEVIEKLQSNRFIAVLGTSGSGKSSLMYCGLIPSLHGGFMFGAGSNWRVVVTRPGISPIRNMAEALVNTQAVKPETEEWDINVQAKQSVLRSSSLGLIESIKRMRKDDDENILLLVDQFEELFRFNRLEDDNFSINESAAFVKLLVEVVEQSEVPIYIVMTMRSDYIGDCAQFPQLTSLINDSHYLIPQMTRDQKKEAILGPVAVGGGTMTQRMVQRLLNDLGENPDQLPILQHSLMRTWNYWVQHGSEASGIDLIHYEAIGKMEGALSQHADEAYEELNKRQKDLCAILFKTLTEKGVDGRGVRRPTRLGDIAEIARVDISELVPIIDSFRRVGRTLLMPPPTVPLDEDAIIDISHESLMRIWVRCKEWVENEADSVKTYLRLAEAAALYQVGKATLWRPPDLQLALNWRNKVKPNIVWAQRYDPAFERTMVFLDTSQKEYEDEQRSKDRLQKRAIRQQKVISIILTFAVIGAVILVIFAQLQSEKAENNAKKAEEEKLKAQTSAKEAKESEQKALEAQKEAQENFEKAEEEREYALEQEKLARDALTQADIQRQLALQEKNNAQLSAIEADSARQVALAQENKAKENLEIATKAREEADLSAEEAQKLRFLSLSQTMAVKSLRLSDTIQSALVAKQAYIFHDRYQGNPYHPDVYDGLYYAEKKLEGDSFNILAGHEDAVRDIVVTKEKDILFTVGSDGRILKWVFAKGAQQEPEVVFNGDYIYRSVALNNDQTLLACGTGESKIQLINLESPSEPILLEGHTSIVWDVHFTPDGKGLISTGEDQKIIYWDLETYEPTEVATAEDKIRSIEITEAGILYGLLENGKLNIWKPQEENSESLTLFEISGQKGTAMAFSATKQIIVQGYVNGLVRVWDLKENNIVNTLEGHNAKISDIAISKTGKFIATASLDGTVRVWQTDNLEEDPIVLSDHGAWVLSTMFSSDEKHIYVGTIDQTIRFYPINMKDMANRICDKLDRNMDDEEWVKYVGEGIEKELTCTFNEVRNN